MERIRDRWLDLVLAIWMLVILAQHLVLVRWALSGAEASAAPPDLRPAYWVLGLLVLAGAVLRHARAGGRR